MGNNHTWLIIGLLFIGIATIAVLRDADCGDLTGTWVATSMEVDGENAPEDAVKRMRFRFDGDKLFLRGNFDDDQEVECSFSTDNTCYPKHLNFTPPDEDRPILAIYERNGQTLRVCIRHSRSDQGRPTEFKTTPGSELLMIVFSLKEAND